mmetsp:Transcript_19156/g.41614  ORF Transcript_19156/g.41614 Transcript_19156/m.41614 type:complete len:179 (+) Transcript_19156:183-719(+)|eukprot:CAMPEP_0168182484 /NCGR_PEP_ID=MMETSP0139_2-20121125/11919_1 /TAXON_ID=44445 /ORGANISM="Pseudo-nitzschia australis, Strain 10249 10 AB" /LENGTH=178 /DNA_ID=CAMNT_0008103419 /DNA_START=123 /DNA_END=659 /DNA_ORIENTATION=-
MMLLKNFWILAVLLSSFPIFGEGLRPRPSSVNDFPFSLGVRDSLMIAHSFHDHPSFGPAGGMHGATYTCDVDFLAEELHPETNWVIDIGKALDILSKVLSRYNLKNLDEVFPDKTMTTTEFMCKKIHDDIRELLESECNEFKGAVRIKLWESHKAWATYTGPISSATSEEKVDPSTEL